MKKRLFAAVTITVFLFVLALIVPRISAKNERPKSGKLRVSITTDNVKNKTSVPVVRFDEHPFTSIIRISGNENGANPNQASAIKVVPYLTEKGTVKIDVSVLFGDLTGITSCEEYKKLKQQHVASYQPRKDEQVTTAPALKKLGLLAVKIQAELEGGGEFGCGGCYCNPICCIPNPKQCMGCGSCGTCCRD